MEVKIEGEPLVGHRLFEPVVDGFEFTGKIKGKHGAVWDGVILQASCEETINGEIPSEVDPLMKAEKHLRNGVGDCGIYVVKDKNNHNYWSSVMANDKPDIEATVSAWGVCIEGTTGMRCQHVEITDLTLLLKPCAICSYPAEYFSPKYALCIFCLDKYIIKSDVNKAKEKEFTRWDILGQKISETYDLPLTIQPLLASHFQGMEVPFPMPMDYERKMFDFLVPPKPPEPKIVG